VASADHVRRGAGAIEPLRQRLARSVSTRQRMIALPDLPEYVAALFGTLKNGSTVVMVNPGLGLDEIAYSYEYTRAKVAVVHADRLEPSCRRKSSAIPRALIVVGKAA
jgi:acyl-coenzyme A synthetase/AMP-(fatty) acid ligase